MLMKQVLHQMPAPVGRVALGSGEAATKVSSDETCFPHHETVNIGQVLLIQTLARENMQRAWKRVKANKGASGIDGLNIAQTGEYLKGLVCT